MSQPRDTGFLFALESARAALGSDQVSPPWLSNSSTSVQRADAVISHRLSRLVVNSAYKDCFDEADKERITNDALAHTHAAFQLVGHTTQVVKILEGAGIRFLALKGIALGALGQTPASRGAGDVDILVDRLDVRRVHEVFLAKDFRPALALPDFRKRRTWATWSSLDREATYIGHSTHIDLHWRISSQRHLFPSFADLYARRTEVTVADTTFPTLSLADSLAAACYHAYFDQFQPLRSMLDVVSLIPKVSPQSLPPLPQKLTELMAGVITLVAEEFPGVADSECVALLSVLPDPPAIVRERFNQAIVTPKQIWEEGQDTGALMAKLRAEARFDSLGEVLPRFIGKRLFHFPHWTESQPHTTLTRALVNRFQVESARKKRA